MPPPNITIGSMFVQHDISLPETLGFETDAYSRDWRLVKGLSSFTLGAKMRAFGLRLVFIAGHVEVIEFGWDRERGARRGVKRMLKTVRALHFNCMELAGVLRKHFLGIPYMVISGDTYQIQKHIELESAEKRIRAQARAA